MAPSRFRRFGGRHSFYCLMPMLVMLFVYYLNKEVNLLFRYLEFVNGSVNRPKAPKNLTGGASSWSVRDRLLWRRKAEEKKNQLAETLLTKKTEANSQGRWKNS